MNSNPRPQFKVSVIVLADSISPSGQRITTFQLRYPRFIHSEVMTHRVFSRNASSSRAIPVKKMIQQVREDSAVPMLWGQNQPGMQAHFELPDDKRDKAIELWFTAAELAADVAEEMEKVGVHKQVANRILEPFQYISVVLTATEYGNWFELRDHEDAQPEIRQLAIEMKHALNDSVPVKLSPGSWHLPYITQKERRKYPVETLLKVSAARCCRVSYMRHDGEKNDIEKDLRLCERLVGSRPLHASPFEHQATPDCEKNWLLKVLHGEHGSKYRNPHQHGNLHGWIQYRKLIEAEFYEPKFCPAP